VLENPNEMGVSTVREIAEAPQCQAQHGRAHGAQVGFEGYEDFRAPFREAIRRAPSVFRTGRAGCRMSANPAISAGFMPTWSRRDPQPRGDLRRDRRRALKRRGRGDLERRNIFTLGVGVNNSNARNFTYLASTGMVQFHAIPRQGPRRWTIWHGPTSGRPDRDDLPPLPHRGGRDGRGRPRAGLTVIGLSDSPPARSSAPPITALSWPSTRRSSFRPRSRPSRFWKRC
jgi:hypothetical protein